MIMVDLGSVQCPRAVLTFVPHLNDVGADRPGLLSQSRFSLNLSLILLLSYLNPLPLSPTLIPYPYPLPSSPSPIPYLPLLPLFPFLIRRPHNVVALYAWASDTPCIAHRPLKLHSPSQAVTNLKLFSKRQYSSSLSLSACQASVVVWGSGERTKTTLGIVLERRAVALLMLPHRASLHNKLRSFHCI